MPAADACKGVPRRESLELRPGAAQAVDLVDIDRLEQGLAVREIAVQGSDAHLGATGNLLQRGRVAALGERVTGGGDDLLVVA